MERKKLPPPDLLFDVGQLTGLASKIAGHPWILSHCAEQAEDAKRAALLLTSTIGYPFPDSRSRDA